MLERANVIDALDPNILDWQQSLQLAANKEDLAVDLLSMLVDSFEKELDEIEQLIELEDFPQLEHVLHRLYGATRYVGTPTLQKLPEVLSSLSRPCVRNAVRPMTALFRKY